MTAVRCPDCGRLVQSRRGYASHWAQRHWSPNRDTRPAAIDPDLHPTARESRDAN